MILVVISLRVLDSGFGLCLYLSFSFCLVLRFVFWFCVGMGFGFEGVFSKSLGFWVDFFWVFVLIWISDLRV